MHLLLNTNKAFTKLIQVEIPLLAKIPGVRSAIMKYTSDYLTGARLTDALQLATLPFVNLKKLSNASGGVHREGLDTIEIDEDNVKAYAAGHSTYIRLVPITVLHELTHWGYWKGQQDGHPSNADGRAHQNHGDYQSPLNEELYRALGWRQPTIDELY